jgi:hypothetical protein
MGAVEVNAGELIVVWTELGLLLCIPNPSAELPPESSNIFAEKSAIGAEHMAVTSEVL